MPNQTSQVHGDRSRAGHDEPNPLAFLHPESRLVRRIRTGDARAFEELSRRARRPLLTLSMRSGADYSDAERVVQASLRLARGRIQRGTGPENVGRWLRFVVSGATEAMLRESRRSEAAQSPALNDGPGVAVRRAQIDSLVAAYAEGGGAGTECPAPWSRDVLPGGRPRRPTRLLAGLSPRDLGRLLPERTLLALGGQKAQRRSALSELVGQPSRPSDLPSPGIRAAAGVATFLVALAHLGLLEPLGL